MKPSARTFEDRPAVRERVPLLLGLVGPSSSGKTFSALRLAAGMQRVYGGEVFGIDTENDRMKHHAERFKFRHVPFSAPFGPLDYLAAIEHCINQKASVIIVDSMTHEHSGVGGVMDQIDAILDAKCGDNIDARDRNNAWAHKVVKPQRRKLNNAIVQLGAKAAFIFCYRANDIQYPVKKGWQAETTSTLHYEMMQRFLLPPGSAGYPNLTPSTEAEKLLVKIPEQFKDLMKPGMQISEDIGERLARWAAGDTQPRPGKAALLAAKTPDELAAAWAKLSKADQIALASVKDQCKAALTAAPRGSGPNGEYVHGVDDPAHAPQAG